MCLFILGILWNLHAVVSACEIGELRCPNGTCFPASAVQDGVEDCLDGKYDETGPFCNLTTEIQCPDGVCLPRIKFNNSVNDCGDNADEVDSPCKIGAFSCDNGKCVSLRWVLDKQDDCMDGSDEAKLLGFSCYAEVPCCYCELYIKDSVCRNGTCQCLSGRAGNLLGNECIRRKFGDNCSTDLDCSDSYDNGVCLEGQCSCETGFYRLDNFTGCVLRRIGDNTCSVDDDCNNAVTFSNCQEGVCVCNSGHYASTDLTRCIKRKIGESCQNNNDCVDVIANSNCSDGVCTCTSGYYPTSSNTVCQLRRLYEGTCSENSDCLEAITNSHCSGTCLCDSGYRPDDDNTTCVRRRILDFCHTNTDCSASVDLSFCYNGVCLCLPGHHTGSDGLSCTRRRIHDACASQDDCVAAVANSNCKSGTCLCISGYQAISNRTVCARRKIGDSTCTLNQDCNDAVENSVCDSGVCQCSRGFLANYDNTSCVRMRIRDACLYDVDCDTAVTNSVCRNKRCECSSGFHVQRDLKACIRRKIGDNTCMIDSDCNNAVNNSYCNNGTCLCISGYDALPGMTRCGLRPRLLGEACYFPNHCRHISKFGECHRNVMCGCSRGYFIHRNRTACIKLPTKLQEPCNFNDHCYRTIKDSVCVKDSCTCKQFYFVLDSSTCQANPEKLGDVCLTKAHCKRAVHHSTCNANRTCSCVYGFRSSHNNTRCVERIRIPPFVFTLPPAEKQCNAANPSLCGNDTNIECVMHEQRGYGLCRCKTGFVLLSDQQTCQAVQSYQIAMNITLTAGRYDYLPLIFPHNFTQTSSPQYVKMIKRLTLLGLDKALGPKSLDGRYLKSEILSLSDNQPGLRVVAVVHVTAEKYKPVQTEAIWNQLNESLSRSDGELGESRLKLERPFDERFLVDDFDECANNNYHDCSERAYCINTLGSFMCFCRPVFDDISKYRQQRMGRVCVDTTTAAPYIEGCGDGDCRTNWKFVGLTLTVLFIVLFSLITYEIVHRKRQLSARDAYRRFGRATRQRIQKLRRKSFAKSGKVKGGDHIEEEKIQEQDSD